MFDTDRFVVEACVVQSDVVFVDQLYRPTILRTNDVVCAHIGARVAETFHRPGEFSLRRVEHDVPYGPLPRWACMMADRRTEGDGHERGTYDRGLMRR